MIDEKTIHHGHRKRTKDAMLVNGLDGLNDHQVLEILLFYAVPNGDTNPTAHRLVERFGSLRGVLEADVEELSTVKGIGENAASLIKFTQLISGRYLKASSFDGDTMKLGSTEGLRRFYEGAFLGVKNEQIRAMLVDDSLFMIKEQLISEGTIGKAELVARKFTDFVIKNNCDRIVIAHNHPNGVALPSKEDIVVSKRLVDIFGLLDIVLVDHIIVGRSGSFSLHASDHAFEVWQNEFRR